MKHAVYVAQSLDTAGNGFVKDLDLERDCWLWYMLGLEG